MRRQPRLADLDAGRAQSQAAKFGVPRHGTVDDLLADAEVELVINLTVPAAHASVAAKACASATPRTPSWAPATRPPGS